MAFAVPLVMWTLVQRHHTGQLVFISDKSALNLRVGNNSSANGTYHLQLEPIAEPSGWAFIRERPGDAAGLAGRKLLYFWGLDRDP